MQNHGRKKGRTLRKRSARKKSGFSDSTLYNKLFTWMILRGYRPTRKLAAYTFADTGRGLMTREAIHAGDIIISIPENMLVTPDSVLRTKLGSLLKNCTPGAKGVEILAAFLICEKIQGTSSEWSPYIATLPVKYTVPAYYSAHDLNKCPDFIQNLVHRQKEEINSSFKKMSCILSCVKNTYLCEDNAVDFDAYQWAYCTVNTRCVYKKCEAVDCNGSCSRCIALAPFLDLLNHNSNVKVEATFDCKKRCFEIKSLSHFEKNTQVFINYGSHCNRKLLVEYGFVIPGNINDCVPITWDELKSLHSSVFQTDVPVEKEQFLRSKHYTRNMFIGYDGISWNLEIVFRVLCSSMEASSWKDIPLCVAVLSEADSVTFETLKKKLIQKKQSEYSQMLSVLQQENSEHLTLVNSLLTIESEILRNTILDTEI